MKKDREGFIKLKLTLHPPKKWEKNKYLTDEEIEMYERAIYNDLDVSKVFEQTDPTSDLTFLNEILVEDEVYGEVDEPTGNYFITTYGRVINVHRKNMLKPVLHNVNMSITLQSGLINFKKEFIRLGWIYSQSFILQKYKEYNWKINVAGKNHKW